jgi:hypothetical protein
VRLIVTRTFIRAYSLFRGCQEWLRLVSIPQSVACFESDDVEMPVHRSGPRPAGKVGCEIPRGGREPGNRLAGIGTLDHCLQSAHQGPQGKGLRTSGDRP